MDTYATTVIDANTRVWWVFDYDYDSEGRWALETDEETRRAVAEERIALERGDYVALGAIVQHRCEHCDSWREGDSLWGIVIEPDARKLESFARDSLNFAPTAPQVRP